MKLLIKILPLELSKNKIDYKKIENTVRDINIDKIYVEWINKKNTLGDFGGKLSGGQKQRIGIARAEIMHLNFVKRFINWKTKP